MPRFRKYSPLYNSLLLLTVLITLACGPGLYDENEFPGYFMPSSAHTPPGAEPYYYSPAFLYTDFYDYWDAESDYRSDPVLAGWKKYTGTKLTDSAAAALIYQGKDDPASPLYQALHQKAAAWNYLLIARRIEGASAAGGTIWEPTPADTARMTQLYEGVRDSMVTQSDLFLRDKYAFQSIKLAHLLKKPDTCVALYDRYFGERTDTSVMRYWSLSHKAGALLEAGDTARAVYLFAQIFDRCPTRRKQAYMSLRLSNIRFIPDALRYCKTASEKIAVYTLCAIQPWQDGLPLLQAMAKIDPDSRYLELIMAREINKNEDAYYPAPGFGWYRDTTGLAARHANSAAYFDKLNLFADQCAQDSRIRDQAFWNTAAAYISYVKQDYPKAEKYLSRAQAEPTENGDLKRQILLQKLLLTTDETPQITEALEKSAWPLLDSLRNTTSFYEGNALALAANHLAAKYKQLAATASARKKSWLACNRPEAGPRRFAVAKALILTMLPSYQLNGGSFLSSPDQFAIEDTTSAATLDSTIAFFSQRGPSAADSELMRISGLDLNYLYLVKGRRKLTHFQYAEAAAAWHQVADSFWQEEPYRTYLSANPFSGRILDTHAPTPDDTVQYTPYTFAARMQQLSEEAHQDQGASAEAYYLLGCGTYNMSYYGNSWLLVKRYWSSSDMSFDFKKNLTPADSLNYYSTLRAKGYFDSAMTRASDPELAAKACFMAAKCEQKTFYQYAAGEDMMSVLRGWNWGYGNSKAQRDSARTALIALENAQYHQYFSLLKRRYPDAAFTREVIRQCATYRDFAEGK